MENKKMRIALINQRYGREINGGSEYYTRKLAEQLGKVCEVEILTTKALDYATWEDYYEADVECLDGITVRRFHVEHPRDTRSMRIIGMIHRIPVFREYWENRWIDAQGPYSPDLIRYIGSHKDEYTLFIFVTYLYYHAVRGIPEAAEKAVLLPTAHDEPYIYYEIFRKLFAQAAGLIYLTPEEKEFVESRFPVANTPHCIAGMGIELPERVDNERWRRKYRIDDRYLIYAGRIDQSKGCDEMFRIFRIYKKKHPESKLRLVLMGKSMMEIPEDEDILHLGFVPEEDKFDGISGAEALWLPSKYESLSISVLEALSLGVPVAVNGQCRVLEGHCRRSGAGFSYQNKDEAVKVIERLMALDDRDEIARRAKQYVKENYHWDSIIDRIMELLSRVNRKTEEIE